jgi:hypothetical protein
MHLVALADGHPVRALALELSRPSPKRSRQGGRCHGERERGSNCDAAGMAIA